MFAPLSSDWHLKPHLCERAEKLDLAGCRIDLKLVIIKAQTKPLDLCKCLLIRNHWHIVGHKVHHVRYLYSLRNEESTDVADLSISVIVDVGRILHQLDVCFASWELETADFTSQILDLVLSFVVVWGRSDLKSLIVLLLALQTEVTERWKSVC